MDDKKNDNSISSKCSVCGEQFTSVRECLKHELISHSLRKKSKPNNRMQKRINATVKFLNTDDKIQERERLNRRLSNCKDGEELKTIFELFCIKRDNLDLIFTRIQTCLEKELQPAGIARIYPFGSIACGLALRDCDIDIYLDASSMNAAATSSQKKNKQAFQPYNRISKLLYRSEHFTDVFAIRKTRVPIIKCSHKDTGFSIDINISYPSSRENTQFIYDLVQSDARIHELMLFMKLWAKNTQIIGRGTMSSYCLVTMVIFFLQQPRQLVIEGKEGGEDSRILKSLRELQVDCPFHIVQGVNYAYDLKTKENQPKIPSSVTSWQLIKEFFEFYEHFNFDDHIISPFYGKSIAKSTLTPDIYEEYYNQLKTITQYLAGEPASNIKIDCSMCVQDAFWLNQNTAKNVTPQNKQYMVLCLQNAKKICENPEKLTPAQLYTRLLFETIKIGSTEKAEKTENAEVTAILSNLKLPSAVAVDKTNNSNNGSLVYTVIPSKADLREIAERYPHLIKGNEILQCWCQHYIDAIFVILTELYRMDITKKSPTPHKQLKLDTDESDNNSLNSSSAMSCTIDLWSHRHFQKKSQTTFMCYQLEQTERLHNLRKQDPKFSVTLNATLKLNVLPKNMGIEIKFELSEDAAAESLKKKSSMRKFFNVFKHTLLNFSFKEILNVDSANTAAANEAATTTADTMVAAINADSS